MSSFLTHPVVKGAFLVSALTAGAVAAVTYWDDVQASLSHIPVRNVAGSAVATITYVMATMLSWRSVLGDLGSPLPVTRAGHLFFISQLGKYIPGGVWNVVAVGEMGRERGIPRRSSLGAMLVFWLVSVCSGLIVGGLYVLSDQVVSLGYSLWMVAGLCVGLLVVSPPVLRRILALGIRLLRRPPLPRDPSAGGLARAFLWAAVGWLAAGLQVWLLASPVAGEGVSIYAATSGFALAWTAGFLVVVAPAGAGVREVVLGALLAASVTTGGALTVVLISRLFITLADFGLAGVAVAAARRRADPPLS